MEDDRGVITDISEKQKVIINKAVGKIPTLNLWNILVPIVRSFLVAHHKGQDFEMHHAMEHFTEGEHESIARSFPSVVEHITDGVIELNRARGVIVDDE
jgi:hypothetical protein